MKKTCSCGEKKWRMENKLCLLKSELKLILLTCNMHVKLIISRNELYESKIPYIYNYSHKSNILQIGIFSISILNFIKYN